MTDRAALVNLTSTHKAVTVLAERAKAVRDMPSLDSYERLVDDLLAALRLALGDELGEAWREAKSALPAGARLVMFTDGADCPVYVQATREEPPACEHEEPEMVAFVTKMAYPSKGFDDEATILRALHDSLTSGDDR